MYKYYNPNPYQLATGDCVIRAISKLMDYDWDKAFVELSIQAFELKRIPSDNIVWGEFLKKHGYVKELLPECPNCYSVKEFCIKYPHGKYALYTGSHVIAAIDGCYFDSWDSGYELISYLWRNVNV